MLIRAHLVPKDNELCLTDVKSQAVCVDMIHVWSDGMHLVMQPRQQPIILSLSEVEQSDSYWLFDLHKEYPCGSCL